MKDEANYLLSMYEHERAAGPNVQYNPLKAEQIIPIPLDYNHIISGKTIYCAKLYVCQLLSMH